MKRTGVGLRSASLRSISSFSPHRFKKSGCPARAKCSSSRFPSPRRARHLYQVWHASASLSTIRDNVVQSFLVAARLEGEEGDSVSSMAKALGIGEDKIVDPMAGYLIRIEYSAASLALAQMLPRRSLSVVANDSIGQKVFTIKGRDFFSSTVNSDLSTLVDDARDAL